MSLRRFIAIDPSLTCSGWAMFNTESETIMAVGKIRGKKPPLSMALRLKDLQSQISELYSTIELNSNDVLVCEAPTTMRDPRAALIVEQVRGLFETLARDRGVPVPGRINPRSVQSEVMGLRGKQMKREVVKETALRVTEQLYGRRLEELGLGGEKQPLKRHQDIVDAVLLGRYGIAKLQEANRTGEPWESFFSQNEKNRSARLRARAYTT